MGFLDNSGDIILDAVLTDVGRKRLARGDGSFRITKFALGDAEIDYSNYDTSSVPPDLNVLTTPVFEASTDAGTAMGDSFLMTVVNPNLLDLPVLMISQTESTAGSTAAAATSGATTDTVQFVCLTDETTRAQWQDTSSNTMQGVISGKTASDAASSLIALHQGFKTDTGISNELIDNSLRESRYQIRTDGRLLRLVTPAGTAAPISFTTEDGIDVVFAGGDMTSGFSTCQTSDVIKGAKGTLLRWSAMATEQLRRSDYYFDRLGSTVTINAVSYKYIDTAVQIKGLDTGYNLDVVVRILKKS